MNRSLNIVTAIAAGAALMFYLDPQQGRRRRALVRDKSLSLGNSVKDSVDSTRTHLGNRMKGLAARTGLGTQDVTVDDAQLLDEVQAKIEKLVSNPMAIDVGVEQGVVRLSGRVPSDEHDTLLTKVVAMHGVRDIDDQLDVDPTADGADRPIDGLSEMV